MNDLPNYYLAEAEKARALGQFLEAEEFYERAIAGAAEHELIQEEALAYELAAKHYLARGRQKIAQTYMKEAHYCYVRAGAKAKVEDLETRYPQFFSQSSRVAATSISIPSETIANRSGSNLDLAAVMKASQAIAREIELEQLLRSLMQILIENAGAQTGHLILKNAEEWRIEAACELAEGETVCATQVLQSIPTTNQLPESIIQYVIRTQEPVILNDVTHEGNFIHEPYIQQHQTKSIFCLPLLNQAKLVGVLYLENQLTVGAFTPERSQILNLLSTQAAIAIENAKLYAKLRKSKDKITQFLEAVPVGIAVADASGHSTYFNQRAIQLLGKEPDPSMAPEQAAEAYQVYLAGTDQKYPTEKLPMIQALSGKRTRTEDMEIRRNNATIPVEAWGTPVFDKQGNIICAIAAFQDITERKRAEKLLADYNRTLEQQVAERTAALQESEAKFASAFRASPVAISIATLIEGQYLDVNEAYCRMVGYSREEVIGRTSTELGIFKNYSQRTSLIGMLQETGSIRNLEKEVYTRSGEVATVLWSAERIDLNGQACVLWVCEDITQRKQVEAALQRSEAKFRTIFENSQVGIFRTRFSDGLVIDANQRYADLYGFDSPNQLIGIIHATDFYPNLDDRKQVVDLLKRSGELQNFEMQRIKRDGTSFWGLYSYYLNAADGYIEGVVVDISDRKQAEEALRQSEANYRNLVKAANSIIDRIDTQGRIRYMNDYGLKLFGYEEHEILGRTLLETIIPETETSGRDLKQFVHNLLQNPESYSQNENENLCRDGRRIWVAWSNQAILDEDGNLVEILAVGHDITQRKQAEEALQRSEVKFRAIFENSQVGIFRTRLVDGLILDANQRLAEMFGFDSPNELIGQYGTDFHINPDDRKQIVESLRQHGELQNFEFQIRKRDGTPIWVLYSSRLDATDRCIVGVFADISDRKQAEAALRDVYDKLRLREQELRVITDALPALICYVDINQRYQFVNRTYEDWFKRSQDDILGKTVREVLGEEAYQIAAPNINRALEGQISTYESELPYPFDKRYYSATFIPDFDVDAQVKGYYGLITDISDRKQAEEVLRQSKAQFREQAILSAFRAEVNSALAQSDHLPVMLQRCAEAVVKHFDAAFTRIWTIGQDQAVLELQASAGIYTRLDGTYSRISINSKRIVREGTPRLINNLFDDETFVDQEWAKREGLVAFAGYPILLNEQLVGMIAMFAQQPIPESHFEALGFAAREMALGIKRKQAEAALQASEAELRTLIAAIPDPLYVISAEGQIIEVVAVEPDLRCHPIEGMIGKTLHQLGEKQADEFLGYIQQVLRTQQILTVEYSDVLTGRETWFSARIAPFRHNQVIWLTRDITALKQAEQASILEERNRMAREIHDTLAQAFTGILIQVDGATQVITDDVEATLAHLDTIEELARTGLTEARRSVTALRPQLLEDGDLSSALERLVNQMRVATNTALIYSIQGAAYSLPAEVENNLLRIGQEALTNAIKYANANEIRIELIYDDAQCRLQVKDDGQGFGVVGVPMSGGFGLLGMSERAERIGAHLAIESQPGQGTEIIVIVNRG